MQTKLNASSIIFYPTSISDTEAIRSRKTFFETHAKIFVICVNFEIC